MSLTQAIKSLSGEVVGEDDLSEREAYALMSAMLDGGLGDLELGALLALLESKPVTLAELLGYCAALSPRCSRLKPPPGSVRPVLFACYHGVRSQPHLLPLPLVNQIACCLYGAGYTDDMNQAKAIVAVETSSLAAA